MSWVITVDAKKELITELTITDTFEPVGSMVFMSESLKVLKNGKLLDSNNYTLTDNKAGGFVLNFIGSLDRAKYEIYYKTSFDPDTIKDAKGTINTGTKYINKAKFTGKVKPINSEEKPIGTPDGIADYTIDETVFNGGKKRRRFRQRKENYNLEDLRECSRSKSERSRFCYYRYIK